MNKKMEIIADLQIHSRFARATSKNITLENLEKYARIKGLSLLGTGDFQHPLWNKEIKENLKEDDKGILWSKSGFPFLWQTEVSLMFSQGGKRRAIHLLVFAPNQEIADKIISYLGLKGRLDYDGRPIFGITCQLFVKEIKEISDSIEIVPAHCMTPWFGLFGSDSGFDSLQDCFQDQTHHIYAVESGMSADPAMLWRLKENVNIVSFSDAHSFWPWRLGREATIFDLTSLSYQNIMKAIRAGSGITATIETPPSYGKYHWDGHRNCNFSCSPEETKKLNKICPICKKQMTIGVDFRVDQLAKAPSGFQPKKAKPFYNLIPLHELISIVYSTPLESKKSWEIYDSTIAKFNNELNILLHVSKDSLLQANISPTLVEVILLARENKLKVKPGFDSTYGEVLLPEGFQTEKPVRAKSKGKQVTLF